MKPSIFSKDYNRYIKRKRRIRLILILTGIILVLFLLIFKYGIKSYFDNILNTPVKSSTEETNETNKQKTVTESENKFKEIKLSDSLTIKLGLETEGSVTKYNGILTEGLNASYDISSAKDQMVLLNKDTQNVYLIDKDGKSTDITYKKYVSTSKKVYEKESVLKNKADYIWADSPKFLGEDKILYISNVPWFGTVRSQYLWIYDIKEGSYRHIIKGKSITLNGNKDKGYEVNVDDKLIYIDNDGGIKK